MAPHRLVAAAACRKFVSRTLTIGAFVQRKLARLPIGALPTTTTVSLSLPRSNSPIRKEERLDQKLRAPKQRFSKLRYGHSLALAPR